MPRDLYRLLLFPETGTSSQGAAGQPPARGAKPPMSVMFADRIDAEVIAGLSTDQYPAVAVVEYPASGEPARLALFYGSEDDRARVAAEVTRGGPDHPVALHREPPAPAAR